jgi:hypothetical protein
VLTIGDTAPWLWLGDLWPWHLLVAAAAAGALLCGVFAKGLRWHSLGVLFSAALWSGNWLVLVPGSWPGPWRTLRGPC